MKIAIAGYGIEGQSNYNYWAKNPDNDLTIVDEREIVPDLPEGVKTLLGPKALEQTDGFDQIIRTAGLAPYKIHTNGRIWSATNEFFKQCPAPIVGVTGTKGKGTTSSLIASILEAAGKKVWLVGNIGLAALDVLDQIKPTDVVVYELSSFQLWDLEKSPHIAVILHMEPDHLDVHRSMDEYVMAKANIRLYQTLEDICFYKKDNEYVQQIITAPSRIYSGEQEEKWKAQAFPYDTDIVAGISYATIEGDNFVIHRSDGNSAVSLAELHLPGRHNQQNAVAAIDASLCFEVSDEAIKEGLNKFGGLPHRLKFVREVNGVSFYDDSIATTPGSAIAALRAFASPKVLILGGSSKGADFTELAHIIKEEEVVQVVLIGDEADHIQEALDNVSYSHYVNLGSLVTMKQIVAQASSVANSGMVVILSPSCASFGMFKNYNDRGDQFISAVNEL